MHVMVDTVGKVPRIEVEHTGFSVVNIGEVRISLPDGGATVSLRMTEPQLAGLSHQINRHLDQMPIERTGVVESPTAPVEGAVGTHV